MGAVTLHTHGIWRHARHGEPVGHDRYVVVEVDHRLAHVERRARANVDRVVVVIMYKYVLGGRLEHGLDALTQYDLGRRERRRPRARLQHVEILAMVTNPCGGGNDR